MGKAQKPAPRRPNFIPSTPNYFGYQWIDKDPDMEFVVGILGESGMSPEDVEHETEKLGHKVSRYTIIGWLYGNVRRPQNYTMTIVALACGWSKSWAQFGSGEQSKTAPTATTTGKAQQPTGGRRVSH